jgi:predicted glycosyltransferase
MIWFDLDNSPHVPLFRPMFKELEERNIKFFITAGEYAQTIDLLKLWNIDFELIGKHGGRNKFKKISNLVYRASQLSRCIRDKDIKLAVSHGSRSQLLSAKINGIESILMMDYEYTERRIFNLLSTYLLIPKIIPDERLESARINLSKVIRYNGFKEELYINNFTPEKDFRKKINIGNKDILIVIRPPGMSGNYHDRKSEGFFLKAVRFFLESANTVCLIVNRTDREKNFLINNFELSNKLRFLEKPVDGLQLLYCADICLSGGGTMNREAALLGTRTYSIFTGKRPYLDEYLQEVGKLKFIESDKDLESINIAEDYKSFELRTENNIAKEITDIIENKYIQ